MGYVEFNNNPCGRTVGDCTVRAVSKALNMGWESAYIALTMNGLSMGDMPSSDSVWGATLRQHGFHRKVISDNKPAYYTADEFCRDNPRGVYVLGFGGHVATVINGNLYDSWDSSKEIPQFYWTKEESDDEY